MRNRRSWWELPISIVLLGGALVHALRFQHLPDDAYISFHYATNFAAGAGLVFNPGEYVMGYSNFLWVILLGLGESFGVSAPALAPVLGVILGWGILAIVYLYLRRTYGGILAATAGAALLVVNATFAFWLVGGLEGPLFGLLLLAGVVVALDVESDSPLRSFVGLGVLFGLAALTRPEGVFYAVPVGGYLFLHRRDRARAKRVAVFLGTTLLIFGLFTAWVTFYYGDPMPNPFYAKFHPISAELLERGGRVSRAFLVAYLGVPLVVIGLWALATRLRWSSKGWLPLSIIAAFVVFYLRVGGDLQAYYRMWFWVLPMLALLLGEAVAVFSVGRRRQVISAVLTVGLLAASLQHSFRGSETGRVVRDEAFVRGAVLIGETLAKQHPGATVAANNVGALAYASQLNVLDMLGLTDRHIAKAAGKEVGIPAHESHDGAYVLDQKPDFIFYGMPKRYPEPLSLASATRGGYPSDQDLDRDPRFAREYALDHLRLPDGQFAPVFRRRDYVRNPAEAR
ncbi:MAG: glycosyltransferase family 39 protein [Deltaproteobacteria bacterium]|nr:glycosyltransferase family 39 protein [Deltaproteobacteria bacterium]